MIELTAFHFECLKKFAGVRALTETGLARVMHQDKAIVKHAIKTLIGKGVLKQIGPYEFALSHEGSMHLKAKGAPLTEPAKAPKEKPAPKADSMTKLEALDLPPSDQTLAALAEMTGEDVVPDFYKAITEGDDQLAFNVRKSGVLNIENGQATFTPDPVTVVESTPEGSDKQRNVWNEGTGPGTKPAGQIVFTAPTGDWGKFEAVPIVPALDWDAIKKAAAAEQELKNKQAAAEKPADFATLVRNGLERLNKRLGRADVEIENIDLKIETLAKLSASVETISAETAQILRDVSKDLHRIRYKYSGDDARSSK